MTRKRVCIVFRVSTRNQKKHLDQQLTECRAFCKRFNLDVIFEVKIVGPVWGTKYKKALRKLVNKAKTENVVAIVFLSVSRAVRIKGYSSKEPDKLPTQQNWDEFYSLITPLDAIFVEDGSYEIEHSLHVRLGNPGRPISKDTAKRIAKELREEGKSLEQIRKTLLAKGYKISRMGISKWLN